MTFVRTAGDKQSFILIASGIVLPTIPKDVSKLLWSSFSSPYEKTVSGSVNMGQAWPVPSDTMLEVEAKKKKNSSTDLIFVKILVCCPSWVYLYQYLFLKIHKILLILTQEFGLPLYSVPEYFSLRLVLALFGAAEFSKGRKLGFYYL